MRASLLVSPIPILIFVACRAPEPEAEQPEQTAEAKPAQVGARAAGDAEAQPSEPTPPADPERADELRDLDELCESVDHDYKDGTLGDYYHGLSLRTDWGRALRDAGLESIQPGRLLERAVNELDPDRDDPALPHCHTLLGYLDDVE